MRRKRDKPENVKKDPSSEDKGAPKKRFEAREAPSEKLPPNRFDANSFSDLVPLLDEASLTDGFELSTMEREVSAEHGIPLSVISRPGKMTQDMDEVLTEEPDAKPKTDPTKQRRRWYEQD